MPPSGALRRPSLPAASAVRASFPRAALLMLLAPVAWWAELAGMPLVAFPASVLALVGGALVLGEAAEVVAHKAGQGIGALLTATLSNLIDLAILGAALSAGLYEVVQAGIAGAIIGNVLFALGGAMFLGGLRRSKQVFPREAATTNTTLLLLASFAIVAPTLAAAVVGAKSPDVGQRLTLPIAIVLFITYVGAMVFSLRTHRDLFNPDTPDGEAALAVHPLFDRHPYVVLVVSVAFVAWMAEVLAGNIEPVGHGLGLSPLFLGIVVIGVVTNAVEIATCWRMALRDRIHVALQAAVGGSIQVVLFVVPVLVFVSQFLAHGGLSLDLPLDMTVSILMTAILINVVASDGESTWYEGAMMLALWAIIAMVFYVHV
ncbi:MAG: calcium/proton exchanger [Halobacteriales archaeon]|nr:calcium/proton exchanger [Halobacteriales archaeon]